MLNQARSVKNNAYQVPLIFGVAGTEREHRPPVITPIRTNLDLVESGVSRF